MRIINCISGFSLLLSTAALSGEAPIAASVARPTNTIVTELPPAAGGGSNAPVVFEISVGEKHGNNIFHNFEKFSVPDNHIASFVNKSTNQSDNSVSENNIIASIVPQSGKGIPTKIEGTLRSEGFNTVNLFIINSAGVVFEKGASLDLSGSFYVSTGDSIEFTDGKIFSTIDQNQSVFSSAQPAAFGFIAPQPISISVTNAGLSVKPGKTILLSGTKLDINDSVISAESGKVMLLAKLNSEGKMPLETDGRKFSESVYQGDIYINSSKDGDYVSTIDVSSKADGDLGHGSVVIRGGNLTISGFEDVNVFDEPDFTPSKILANANNKADGIGTAIDIEISSEFILTKGSELSSDKNDKGSAGNIKLNAGKLIVKNDSRINAVNKSNGIGSSILIETDQLQILGGSKIDASSNTSSGTSGNINVDATQKIQVSGSIPTPVEDKKRPSKINVASAGGGVAGNINICANDACKPDIEISDSGTLQATSSGSSQSAGAGDINIRAADLQILDGGEISNSATGDGKGGVITISADSVLVSGLEEATKSAKINSRAVGNAEGGKITITSKNIQALKGGVISAETVGLKRGGSIFIVSEQGKVIIDDGEITAKSFPIEGGVESADLGSSGDISISSNKISIYQNGKISVTTEGANAGKIDINTTGLLNLKGQGIISTSAQAGKGSGGDINIIGQGKRNLVLIEGNASVTAKSEEGKGGNIFVRAQSVLGATENNVNANKNSVLGEDGTVEFSTPDVDATTGTLELPETYFDASDLITNRCVSRVSDSSGFYVGEREGLGAAPDFLLAGYADNDSEDIFSSGTATSPRVSPDTQQAGLSRRIVCSR